VKELAGRLGGPPGGWEAEEVGDGNLNLVFIISGPEGSVVVKQALPYVRMVGESWPLSLARAHFEHLALCEQARWARQYVPAVYRHDSEMALTVMEHLSPHIILRKGLVQGQTYPQLAGHLGRFLALTLYHTSDLHRTAADKKGMMALFLGNTAMCKITEDLVFDEPYFAAPLNRHTRPQLDAIVSALRSDATLKVAVQELKWRFLNAPEALLHGDLHTGSVMVTENETRAIDPEFAFYGPMGFDVGSLIANLLMAHCAQAGGNRSNAAFALQQIEELWSTFAAVFADLWKKRTLAAPGGGVYAPRLREGCPVLLEQGIEARLCAIWRDTVGYAGCEIIRRIVGLAHVEDFESIADTDVRAAREHRALEVARELLTGTERYVTPEDVTRLVKTAPPPAAGPS
jgi:5-methylthioribose kinase